jgi:hypothetical protein
MKEVETLKLQLQKRDADVLRLQNFVQKQDQEKDRSRGPEMGLYSQNSISFEEEKRILNQVERYSKIIKTLKAQVQDQGKMLLKQQEAIRKLIGKNVVNDRKIIEKCEYVISFTIVLIYVEGFHHEKYDYLNF